MPPRTEIIVACPMPAASLARLAQEFVVHYVPEPGERERLVETSGAIFSGVVTNAATGWSTALMDRMPQLRIICAIGVGYEAIDIDAASTRGISVTHGRGVNTSSVADHALALLFSVVRRVPSNDRAMREGKWSTLRHALPDITGSTAGILGLGAIGVAIATRLRAFEIEILYHNRNRRTDVSFNHVPDVASLASNSDFLIVAAPGGEATRHLVDAKVLANLGSEGYLVNVGRGSIVDSVELGSALSNGVIAGAAIDVFEEEPALPEVLIEAPNLVISPHIAGLSPRSERAYVQCILDNLTAKFAGRELPTPVPGSIDAPDFQRRS
jgi:lactate dehydrogenase-like 2-hydroxyacid dehydrogenase